MRPTRATARFNSFNSRSEVPSRLYRKYVFAAAILACACPTFASADNWIGGTDTWDNAVNWDSAATPQLTDDVFITPITSVVVTGSSTPTTVNSLVIGYLDGSALLSLQSGGDLTTTTTITLSAGAQLATNGANVTADTLSINAAGIFDQEGGTTTIVNQLNLGLTDAGGSFLLACGTLTANTITLSNGTFTQTGGNNSVIGDLSLAINPSSAGNYSLSNGTTSVGGSVFAGGSNSTGTGGSGNLALSGNGTLTIAGSLTVFNSNGTTVNFSGGNLSVSSLNFNGNPSLFNWTAGTLNLNADVIWDSAASANSTSSAFGSSLSLATGQTFNINGNETLGGTAAFTLTLNDGGVHAVSGSLTVDSDSALLLSGGSLSANSVNIGFNSNGSLTQSGGNHSIAGILYLGVNPGSIGNYTLSGNGSLSIAGFLCVGDFGNGNFNQTGGLNTINSGVFIVGLQGGSTGTYTLSGDGTITTSIGEFIGFFGNGNFIQTSGNNTMTSNTVLELAGVTGSQGNYSLSGTGALTTGTEYIGYSGNGNFTQSGGTNTVMRALYLAVSPGSVGIFSISDGTTDIGGSVYVGGSSSFAPGGTGNLTVSGNGSLAISGTLTILNSNGTCVNLSGGNLSVSSLNFNGNPSHFYWTAGTLNLNADVTWDSAASANSTSAAFGSSLSLATGKTLNINGNETLGGTAAFTLTLDDGSVHAVSGSLTLDSDSTLLLHGGSLSANSENIGFSSNGSLTQSGGNHSIAGNLTIAANIGSSGIYSISNGTLAATAIQISADGALTQSGGNVTTNSGLVNAGIITVGGGSLTGPINNSGSIAGFGNLTSSNFTNSGNITLTASTQLNITTAQFTNTGSFSNDGSLQTSADILNSGTFIQNGPQSWSNGSNFTNSGNATITTDTGSPSTSPLNLLNTAGLLQLATPQHINSLSITGGNVTLISTANPRQDVGVVFKTASLSIASTSSLDVTNHDLIIGNTDITTVQTEILNGIGAGPGGAAITSSTAIADGNKFLVPLDATALALASWDNVPITDPNSVVIKCTFFGDANLDGQVDGNDFSAIAGDFGNTTPGISDIQTSWLMGDLNLDGVVDGNDFSVVAGNFGDSLLTTSSSSARVSPTNVPEPTTLAILGSAIPLLLRRRSKSSLPQI